MAVKLTETEIRRQIQDYLKLKNWYVWYNLQGLGCFRGIPDLMAAKDGEVISIEVKRPGGRQSDYQEEFQANIEAAGCRYILARGIEDLQKEGI